MTVTSTTDAELEEDKRERSQLITMLLNLRYREVPDHLEMAQRLGFYHPEKKPWWARAFPCLFGIPASELRAKRELYRFEQELRTDPTPSQVQQYARALDGRIEIVLTHKRRYHSRPPSLATHMRHRRHELAAQRPVPRRHLVL